MIVSEVLLSDDHERRRTKIVATIGPASSSKGVVKQLIENGVNVFRLNLSHGSYAEHEAMLTTIRAVAQECNVIIAILQDLAGPKLRITTIDSNASQIQDKADVILHDQDSHITTAQNLYLEETGIIASLKPGERILLGDGLIVLEVVSITAQTATCRALKGGQLRSRMGIAFPDSNINLSATTQKDFEDIAWGAKQGFDYVALSFVKDADDLIRVKAKIAACGGHAKIIAKIERRAAVENLDSILDHCDGVMVARGDLGTEIALEKIPMIQKLIIEKANNRGVPAIVATQMLQSMITALRPTRAEVADISAAVMGGADAVMLSEETAIGDNPVEAVRFLARIAREAERSFKFEEFKLRLRAPDTAVVPDAIAYAACGAAVKVKAAAIIACTETGTSARLIAKYRPQQPLYGASSNQITLRRLCLNWGVIPIPFSSAGDHATEITTALKVVQTREGILPGSRAVITGGLVMHTPGATSVLEVREF